MRRAALLSLFVLGCPKKSPPVAAAPEARCGLHSDGSQTFGILHVNDVYRIEGLLDGRGGIARLARLRNELEADCPDLLLTHGGDFLSPGLLSKSTNTEVDPARKIRLYGEHMVEMLSWLDGDGEAFDPHMFIAIGNHEFDNGGDVFGPTLDGFVANSGFTWLDTNITWQAVDDSPAPDDDKLMASQVVTFGELKVGLFGMTLEMDAEKLPKYVVLDNDRAQVAEDTIAALDDVDVRIAVTHLDVSDDLALLEAVPSLDLIVGGHNHNAMTRTTEDGRLVLKADADAATVRVVYVTVHPSGLVDVAHDAQDDVLATILDGPGDPVVQAEVDRWEAQLADLFCGPDDLDCLKLPLTMTGNAFVAEELEMRRYETNVGDAIADLAVDAYADQGAQLAFINSGGLRLNQTLPADVAFTRRQVEELFPYNAMAYLVELTGAELQGVANRSVEGWEGNGHWLQISGWGFVHDPDANGGDGSATSLSLLPPGGEPVPIDPAATYRVVTNEYLVTSDYGDRDGYTFEVRYVDDVPQGEVDLKERFADLLRAQPVTTLPLDGRICNTQRPDAPCRVPR